MINGITNYNSKNVAFSASPTKVAKKAVPEGTKLGEKMADTFQKSKISEPIKGLSSKPIRFDLNDIDEPETLTGLSGSSVADTLTVLSSL